MSASDTPRPARGESPDSNPSHSTQPASSLPDSPGSFKWHPPPPSTSWATGQGRRDARTGPFAVACSTPIVGPAPTERATRDEPEDHSIHDARRQESTRGAQAQEPQRLESDVDEVMAPPLALQNRRRQQETVATRRPPVAHPPGKARIDLNEMRLGGGIHSPLPPAIHRSPPAPTPLNLSQDRLDVVRKDASESAPAITVATEAPVQGNNNKKRALSNDSNSRASNPSVLAVPRPRASTSTMSSTGFESVAAQATGNAGGASKKVRRVSQETKQCEKDAGSIHAAVSDMISRLKIQDNEIFGLKEDLEEKRRELAACAREHEKFKESMSARTREALAKVEAANQSALEAFMDARATIRATENEAGEMRREMELVRNDLKKPDEIAKESSTLQVIRELKSEISNRDEVIKLLRRDLETRAGEIAEARGHNELVESQRTKAYDRLELVSKDLESARAKALEDWREYRDRLDEALLAGAAREEEMNQQRQEMHAQLASQEEEFKNKLEKVHQESEETRRHLVDAHNAERLRLERDAEIRRDEADQVPSLKSKVKRLEEELQRAQNSVQGLVKSSEQDREAFRTKQIERQRLEQQLESHAHEIQNYKLQMTDLERRLSTSAKAAAETHKAELERVETQLQRVGSAKALVEMEVHSIRSERDSLATTVSRLESALSAAQLSSDSLGSDAARLAQQLEASEAVRSTQVARIGELEALEREVQTLRSVERELEDLKDKFDSKKEAFAREKSDELRLGLQDIHARALMELQNKNKKLDNKVKAQEKQLNKVRNELAAFKGKPVLNPNSSSTGSPESTAANQKKEPEADDLAIEGEQRARSSTDTEELEAARERKSSQVKPEDSATLAEDDTHVKKPSPSPLGTAPVMTLDVDSHQAQGHTTPGNGTDPSSSLPLATFVGDVFAPPTEGRPRARKRSISTEDSGEADDTDRSVVVSRSKSLKRSKRTASNENKGPHREEEKASERKPKTRGGVQPSKYQATTKKKK